MRFASIHLGHSWYRLIFISVIIIIGPSELLTVITFPVSSVQMRKLLQHVFVSTPTLCCGSITDSKCLSITIDHISTRAEYHKANLEQSSPSGIMPLPKNFGANKPTDLAVFISPEVSQRAGASNSN